MGSMYGIIGIKVVAIEAVHGELGEVNEFLKKHDGNIIDIKVDTMLYGYTKYIIIYKE